MADLTKIMILVHCNEWGEIREREGGMERERDREGKRREGGRKCQVLNSNKMIVIL